MKVALAVLVRIYERGKSCIGEEGMVYRRFQERAGNWLHMGLGYLGCPYGVRTALLIITR